MKFYSEITEKLYDTPEELQAEEEKFRAEATAAEERTMKYITCKKEVDDAIDNARKLLNEFIRDWGSYSYKANVELKNGELIDLCNLLFNRF